MVSAYKQAVRDAFEDSEYTWHSGWLGNIRVQLDLTDRQRGLCWEWVLLVYPRVRDVAVASGLGVGTVSKHVGSPAEHHAVIVFEVNTLTAEDGILHEAMDRPGSSGTGRVWVLDPWRTGRADIFDLQDWLPVDRSRGVQVSVLRIPAPRWLPPECRPLGNVCNCSSTGQNAPRTNHSASNEEMPQLSRPIGKRQ